MKAKFLLFCFVVGFAYCTVKTLPEVFSELGKTSDMLQLRAHPKL